MLDSWAVLAWLQGQATAPRVRRELERAEHAARPLLLSTINAGEVYYVLARSGQSDRAEEFITELRQHRLPIRLVPVTATRLWDAARVKARHAIAYADAFAAALAKETRQPLLTGDREFASLEHDKTCTIAWLS